MHIKEYYIAPKTTRCDSLGVLLLPKIRDCVTCVLGHPEFKYVIPQRLDLIVALSSMPFFPNCHSTLSNLPPLLSSKILAYRLFLLFPQFLILKTGFPHQILLNNMSLRFDSLHPILHVFIPIASHDQTLEPKNTSPLIQVRKFLPVIDCLACICPSHPLKRALPSNPAY